MGQHQGPFKRWDESSWIRSKPMRFGKIDGLPYSPAIVPLAMHPWIRHDPERFQKVLAYRLLGHLCFTQLLELAHVNTVCAMLGRGDSPVGLDHRQRQDAIRIYCDEGGHALFVTALAEQTALQFAIDPAVVGRPQFDDVLHHLMEVYGGKISPRLIRLFFVTVSETLVTRVLFEIPQDPRVAQVVRQVLHDHCQDESAHAVYFRELFPLVWHALSPAEKRTMGQILPQLVWVFLGPDRRLETSVLRSFGLSAPDARGLLDEVYPAGRTSETVRHDARQTMNMFERAGVFVDPVTRQSFADYELLGGAETVAPKNMTPGELLVWTSA